MSSAARRGLDGDRLVAPRVLISYAHDDEAHEARVRDFWLFLRANGIDTRLNPPGAEDRQDWAQWMTQQVREADRVLVVASPEYKRRPEGDAGPQGGRGVQWEERLIRDLFYGDQEAGLRRFIPVVLPGCSASDIPLWLSPASATYCVVSEYSVAGAEALLRLLTGQPRETDPLLGPVPYLPQRQRAYEALAPKQPMPVQEPARAQSTESRIREVEATSASALVTLSRIFVSYRHEDTAYPSGWLFDKLVQQFGQDQVFKDIDSIQPGDDFVEQITAAVEGCDVLLALIGRRWLTITDEDGRRRLDNPNDYVRLEIEAAIMRNVRVIPILVEGAQMPRAGELPPSLAKLARRQAVELSPSHFHSDTSRLLKVLDRTLANVRVPPATSE